MDLLLQRLLLTRENYVIQMIVMEVLKQVMKTAQEDLADRKKLKLEGIQFFYEKYICWERDKSHTYYIFIFSLITDDESAHHENNEALELDLLGEGEESGELTPGKSLVFAVLEVCLCLLVRQIPALNPNPGGATAILSQKGYIPSEESGKLISLSLNIMESLPTLCSPQGTQCFSLM